MIKALYTDGSTAFKNPSPYGISWCFIVVNDSEEEVYTECGVVTTQDCKGYKASNNLAEMLAAVRALEYATRLSSEILHPDLVLYSDSELTLNRIFKNYSKDKLPSNVKERLGTAFANMKGRIRGALLAGHPTKADLAQGYKVKATKRYPVSKWNVQCDKICGEAAKKLIVRDN